MSKARSISGAGSPVPALTRGLDILRLFKRTRPVIAAPEMARELGIPRSTVHRLAQVLEAMGFSKSLAKGAVRLSLGWSTTEAEIDCCLKAWRKLADTLLRKERNTA